jgi:hypothetical protein
MSTPFVSHRDAGAFGASGTRVGALTRAWAMIPRQVACTLEDREILSTRRHSRSGQSDVHPRAVFVDELIVGDP